MNRYTATVHREGDWWVIDVEGVGATQAKRLDKVSHMARDLVAAMHDVDYDEVHVEVRYAFSSAVEQALTEAQKAAEAARVLAKVATDSNWRVIALLHGEQMSLRDIAHLTGVSFQRVHQILAEPEPALGPTADREAARKETWNRVLEAVRAAAKPVPTASPQRPAAAASRATKTAAAKRERAGAA